MMKDILEKRRSYYQLNKALPMAEQEVQTLVEDILSLVPDAFNMKSQRLVLALGEKQEQLWDAIYDAFSGKVAREKIDSFKAAAGTVLYFTDRSVIEAMQAQYALFAENFPVWASQANGMLQFSVWAALREQNIGASLQHYNPVIDDAVRKLFALPESWQLVAQMPFGGIAAEPEAKDAEARDARIRVFR